MRALNIEDSEPPEIDERTAFWLYVFDVLSPSRGMSDTGPRPIPVSEIKAQCEFTPLPASPDEIQAVVRAMDNEFLEYAASKRKKK